MSSDILCRHTALFQAIKGSPAKFSDVKEMCQCKTKDGWVLE